MKSTENTQFYKDFFMSIPSFSDTMNLDGIFALLEDLKDFHKDLNIIHIAGTNGKGSTAAMLSSVYMHAGYKVGTFTSPYFSDIRECISIDTAMITSEAINRAAYRIKESYERLKTAERPLPTHYECITVAALLCMHACKVDLCVIETLMGGKDDATNIFEKPLLSIITAISFDHTEFLGTTLESISAHKAGIIKPNCPVILNKNPDSVLNVLKQTALEKGSKYVESWNLQSKRTDTLFQDLALEGRHQYENLLGVVAAIDLLSPRFPVAPNALIEGLKKVVHPCRLEWIHSNNCSILLDGSHNLQGIQALYNYVCELTDYKRPTVIFGILKDKDIASILPIIVSMATNLILVTPESPRGMAASELFERLTPEQKKTAVIANSMKHALDIATQKYVSEAFESATQNDMPGILTGKKKQAPFIVACGSFTVSFPIRNLLIP